MYNAFTKGHNTRQVNRPFVVFGYRLFNINNLHINRPTRAQNIPKMYGKTAHSGASTVAHNWANKYEGKYKKDTTAGSLFYEGKTIYSYGYHFAIAKHVLGFARTGEQIKPAILFTTRGYSNTTARHISVVRQATHGLVIYCAYPDKDHDANLNQWLKDAELCHYKSNKAKQQRTKLGALAGLAEIEKEAKIYCEFFGLDIATEAPVLVEALKCNDTAQLAEYTVKKEQAQKVAEAHRQKELKKKHAKELRKFRAFQVQRLYTHDGNDYLRFNTESQRIETSQAVEIPLRTGKAFYKQILQTVKTSNCVICGQQFMDRYEIKEINKDFVIVGCHKISIKEVQKLATSLNW